MSRHGALSSKGQVTIPKEVREALGLEPGDLVVNEVTGTSPAAIRRIEPYGEAFHLAANDTLDEWGAGLPGPCELRLEIFTIDYRLILRRLGQLATRDSGVVRRRVDDLLA